MRGESGDLLAGAFSAWLRSTRSARAAGAGAEVPCGDCTACCRSSYFVHVAPEEVDTLARIPEELKFPAPGLPEGNVVLGYDENGHCPMLVDGRCSIYEHRPLTCRSFDCRVLPAAGVAAGGAGETPIDGRVRRWKFGYPNARDREEHAAVRAAAEFLGENAARFANGVLPRSPTQLAVLAIEVHELFLESSDGAGEGASAGRRAELVRAIAKASERLHGAEREGRGRAGG